MPTIFPHKHFVGPRQELKAALQDQERGRFIFVIGPSGVGKTTLRRTILRKMCGNPAEWGGGRIPVIERSALLSKGAHFSSFGLAKSLVWQLFAPDVRWLRDEDNLKDPLYMDVSAMIESSHRQLDGFRMPKGSEDDLWQLFQRFAPSRGVWLTAIDQAHALCTNHINMSPADHILNLLSILEHTDMNILLCGVHGAAELWATRTEVRRRSTVIWMPPYSYERKEDRDPFLTLLRTLGEGYSFSTPNLLFNMAAELMAASAGIFGVLEKILSDAKKLADSAGRRSISKGDITASYYCQKDFDKLWKDVALFQEAMRPANTKIVAARVSSAWGLAGKSKVSISSTSSPGTQSEEV